jgi:TRAP-type C4-dicarboxylate transport system substrate-binding protein
MAKHSNRLSKHYCGCAMQALIVLCGVAFTASSSLAQEFVMKFSTQTINDVHQEFMRQYKVEIEKATNNRIRVDIYTGAQLGAGARQTEGLRLGTIEAAIGPAELFVGADPRFQGLALAGLFKDEAHARRALMVPAVRQAIADVAASRNLLLIGVNLYAL